jgi:hypothetical protein
MPILVTLSFTLDTWTAINAAIKAGVVAADVTGDPHFELSEQTKDVAIEAMRKIHAEQVKLVIDQRQVAA